MSSCDNVRQDFSIFFEIRSNLNSSLIQKGVKMDRSTTVLFRDLEEDQKSRTMQDFPLLIFRQFSTKENGKRPRSLTSILRRSISDSVERNLCHRVGLHQACREGLVDLVRTLLQGSAPTINTLDEEGFAPLHYAARYDRAEIVKLLIEASADLNICSDGDNKFTTPLQMTARFNSPDTARLLILNGADVAKQSNYGQQALHYAARRGNLKVVQVLLKEGKARANATDNENSTPLHAASQEGKLNVVEILLQYGANPSLSDNDGYTAVHLAAKEGHDDVLEKLLYTASNVGVSCSSILNKMSCLHLAVQHGHIKSAEVCIKYGADTCALQDDLSSPLHVACTNGHYDMAKLLLLNEASIHDEDADGMTPILRASLAGNMEIIELLLSEGAHISPQADSRAPSPLMCAVKRGHHCAVKFLLQHGSPIDLRDVNHRTCLHVAVYSSEAETLRTIIQAGGECLLNSRDKNDKTPLHYAATQGNLQVSHFTQPARKHSYFQIVQELLIAGATLDIKDEDERIPLHCAVENGDLPCVRVLLEACPDSIHATDFRLQNCLHFSASHGHLSVVKYLVDQGAAVDSRDDERLTPLIQAAFCGCPFTTGVLLDQGAKIDATDKNGCTALIAAASQGKVKVLRLLLDRGADLRIVTTDGKNSLETAITNGHQDACMEIIKHVRWKEALPLYNRQNSFMPLKRLIETFPLVAKVVMDKCIQSSHHLSSDEDYSVTYEFAYMNPDPSLLSDGRVFFAPKTMLDYGREELIFHPLTIELMRCKWQHIGVRFFYMSALIYMFYLANLTLYMLCIQDLYLLNPSRPVIPVRQGVCITAHLGAWEIVITVMTAVYLLIEVHQAMSEKWRYVETSNVVEVSTFSTALISTLSYSMGLLDENKYIFLVISVLCGYLTLLLYFQSIFESGIHVTMLFVVLKTLGKVAIMFCILIFAFALVFQLLLSREANAIALNMTMNSTLLEEIRKDPFGRVDLSIMKVVAMAIGEIEYTRFFMDQKLFSPTLSRIVFLAFCVMMPIVLMNLTIGLAVGDIDSIQQNAEYKRLSLKIDVIHKFKEKLPLWLLHRLHQSESVRRPNKKAKNMLQKIKGLGDKLVSGRSKYTAEDEEKNVVDQLSKIFASKMNKQDNRINSLSSEMKEQRILLEKLYQVMSKNEARRSLSDD
ncbi:hypothetical protein OS493_010658 [Desmophyllum pertusum]|uniref:Ion transport domain-containing protein n=1 Tax=Desmophyllum pertusum TaxID=174260 RepID=A0A9W9ZSB4_9CNID|nr:hypothetical protein OS493_010658 [Desmophyllum pertusum]